jgi:hypothetical protein
MSDTSTESLLDDPTQGASTEGAGGNGSSGATDPKPAVWQEQLSAELKGHELLSGIENVNDLGAKHVELAGKLDNAIFKPGEGAPEADVKAYREAMNIPSEAKGYEIQRPDMPDGLVYDDATEAAALEVLHKAGASQEIAQTAMDFFNNLVIEAYKDMAENAETARADTKAALEKDWGDAMKPNVQGAEQVVSKFGTEGFKLLLEENGLTYNPEVYRTFHAIRQVLSEDTLMPPAEGGGGDGQMERTTDGTPQLDYSKTMDANGNPL